MGEFEAIRDAVDVRKIGHVKVVSRAFIEGGENVSLGDFLASGAFGGGGFGGSALGGHGGSCWGSQPGKAALTYMVPVFKPMAVFSVSA